jgi:hypothetical protein
MTTTTLYKGNESRDVYPVDLAAHLKDGWTKTPPEDVIEEQTATGGLINLNNTTLEALRELGLTVAESQKILKANFESVEAWLMAFPVLEAHKAKLVVS